MYKIQKNIPIPTKDARGRKKLYPFDDMEVGDSFAVPLIKKRSISCAVSQEHKKHQGERRFSVRVLKNEIRIWRVQ